LSEHNLNDISSLKIYHLIRGNLDFSQSLTDTKGEPLRKGEEGSTLLDNCSEALLGYAAKPGQNAELFVLLKKIAESGEIDLKAEDVVLLKERLEHCPIYKPLATRQAIMMLDSAVA
jgi:hypothetical protein